jgi:23S rRNA (adenine2503-C2)-methyltransferase
MNKDLKDKTLGELEQIVVNLGQKKYLAEYIFHFIHAKDATDISQITPLSKDFRGRLAKQGYYISQLSTLKKLTDKDGTTKYSFALGDGSLIETVLLIDSPREIDLHGRNKPIMRVGNISRGKDRKTLCVSTQAGCAIGCTFCATARIKLRRNLTAAEIVDQVNIVARDSSLVHRVTGHGSRVTNVVYMGMGEPLLNYNAVLKSVRILNQPAGKNIGIRHLTISTCGIVPGIKKLADEDIQPRLAVSLNAPNDTLRTQLMPINTKYPIANLLKAVRLYQERTGQRVTFEYVLIKGLNDSAEHARMLIKLLSGLMRNVNLIEHNPHPGCDFVGSDSKRIKQFASILEQAGIETTIRFRMGRGIKAACGQLGAEWIDIHREKEKGL